MKAAVIFNPKSGKDTITGKTYSEDDIKHLLSSSNIDSTFYNITEIKLSKILDEIINSGNEIIIAAGGDGTVNSVCSSIVNKQIPVAILPMGTLNHLAKDLNIPLNIEAAIKLIGNKKIKKIDIASVNGNYFINNSSIGLYPKIVKQREEQIERIGGNKWIAMLKATSSIFKRYSIIKVTLKTDDENISIKTPFVFVGNNRYQMDIFNLGKRVKLNERILSVYYPSSSNKLSLMRFAVYTLINKLSQEKDFTIKYLTTLKLEIKKKNEINVALDGEVFKLKSPLNYKIHKEALTVIVP